MKSGDHLYYSEEPMSEKKAQHTPKPMTPEDIRSRVEALRRMVIKNESDNERWHALEDDIRADVLAAIATGAENSAALAREALRTSGIAFTRWYS
jgi:hypothetical protein